MYREHAPPPALASLVQAIWTIRSGTRLRVPRLNRVLPDGCMDFIFDLGEPPAAPSGSGHPPRSYAVGTMSRALVVTHAGRVDLIGVRFRPGAAPALTGVPADELRDRMVPLADVLPAGRTLEARLAEADPESRPGILSAALAARRAETGAPDARVRHATDLIRRRGGRVPVGALARAVNLGHRQLERLFAREVGESPKEACRVARLQAAVATLVASPGDALARVAVRTGYHDQAHMTREFRRLAGVTPGAFRRERDVGFVQDAAGSVA